MKTFTAYRPLAHIHGNHQPHQLNAPDMPQYQGVVFDDGSVAIRWLTAKKSTSVWDTLADCLDIHGHAEYGTYLVWDDGRVENYLGEGKFEARPMPVEPLAQNVVEFPGLFYGNIPCEKMLRAIADQQPADAFVIAWPADGSMPSYHSSTKDAPCVLMRLEQFKHRYYSGEFAEGRK